MAKISTEFEKIKTAVLSGEYSSALELLESHIIEEHHVESDFSQLSQCIGAFQQELLALRRALTLMKDPSKDSQVLKRHLEQHAVNCDRLLFNIKYLLYQLVDQDKLERPTQ